MCARRKYAVFTGNCPESKHLSKIIGFQHITKWLLYTCHESENKNKRDSCLRLVTVVVVAHGNTYNDIIGKRQLEKTHRKIPHKPIGLI